MSRSRRKTPIIGHTKSESDASWKAKASRAVRRAVHATLDSTGDGDALPVKRWSVVNPWDAPKDGKQWLGAGWQKEMRK